MESTGLPIQLSLDEVCKTLDIELKELEDWTCCGCPGAAIDELGAISIAARNLALAEKTGLDLVSACSCCYRNLLNAHLAVVEDPRTRVKVNKALASANLEYKGGVRVRNVIDVFINDIGVETIASKVKNKLEGLKVACWYGCHQTRPYGPDNFELPQWQDSIVESLGAETIYFPLKAQCCGGIQLISGGDMALKLVYKLLDNATNNGAQCIATTACPLCFTNLDAYQGRVNGRFKTKFNMPILAITQIMGVAFGLKPKALGLDKNISSWNKVLAPYLQVLV
jgi:heterodisulfide reductase subunit B